MRADTVSGAPDGLWPEMTWMRRNCRLDEPDHMKAQDMTGSRMGRVVLHLWCAVRDHHWRWHWQGIRRELGQEPD